MRCLGSLIVFAGLGIAGSAFGSTAADSTLWRMTFDSGWLGPVEAKVEIDPAAALDKALELAASH